MGTFKCGRKFCLKLCLTIGQAFVKCKDIEKVLTAKTIIKKKTMPSPIYINPRLLILMFIGFHCTMYLQHAPYVQCQGIEIVYEFYVCIF